MLIFIAFTPIYPPPILSLKFTSGSDIFLTVRILLMNMGVLESLHFNPYLG